MTWAWSGEPVQDYATEERQQILKGEFNRAWNLFCTCLTILACAVVIRLGWMLGNWICSIGKVPQ